MTPTQASTEAYERYVRDNRDRFRNYVERSWPTLSPDDVVQEAFIDLWSAWEREQFTDPKRLANYMQSVLRNAAIDEYRIRGHQYEISHRVPMPTGVRNEPECPRAKWDVKCVEQRLAISVAMRSLGALMTPQRKSSLLRIADRTATRYDHNICRYLRANVDRRLDPR